jgi:hypothetical protein
MLADDASLRHHSALTRIDTGLLASRLWALFGRYRPMESDSRFTVQQGGTLALAPSLRSQNTVPLVVSNPASRRRIREKVWSLKLDFLATFRTTLRKDGH